MSFYKIFFLWNHLAKWNQTIQGSIYGRSCIKYSSFHPWFDNNHGHHVEFLILIVWVFKNLLLWNHLAKWNQTLQEASMGGPLQIFLIYVPDWTTNMAANGQFLFLIGWYKKSSPLKLLGQMEPYLKGSICGKAFTKFLHFLISSWYKSSSFHVDLTINMAPMGSSCLLISRKL